MQILVQVNGVVTSVVSMRVPVTDHIDFNIAGVQVRSRKVDLAAFVAGYLQEMMISQEFLTVHQLVKEKVRHLSYLVHLVCRCEDFDIIYEEYKTVQDDMIERNFGWDNDLYFRDWEKLVIKKIIGLPAPLLMPDQKYKVNGFEDDKDEVRNKDLDEEMKEEPDSDFDPVELGHDDNGEDFDENYNSEDEYQESWPPVKIELEKKPRKKSENKMGKKKQSKQYKENHRKKKKLEKDSHSSSDSKTEKDENGKKVTKWHRYSCDDCNVHNLSFRMHTRHLFEHHEQTLCTHCGINFEDFKVFWVHQESHKEKHICDICSNEFRSAIYLRNHKRIMHNIMDEKYTNRFCQICPVCGKSVDSLKQHMMLVHSTQKFQCPHCEYQTPYKNNLKNHIENKHTGGNIKNCPFCNKLVKNVKRHVLAAKCDLPEEERNNPADMVTCDRCNKQFKNLERLKKHIRDIHDKPAIQCQYCNFQTKYNCNMRMHIRRVHENKPLRETCPICNKECVSVDWHIKTYHPAEIENGFVPP